MTKFTNMATLSYNGNVANSNIVTGELREVLTATKTAVVKEYSANRYVTYVISIINSGTTPYTGLTVVDDLGEYDFETGTLTPLTYVDGSLKYYLDGELQTTAPTVTTSDPLTITGVNVPSSGNALLIYEAVANQFAPLATDSTITNEATISGGGLTNDITVEETIRAYNAPELTISKSLSPTTVNENGQLTYTFVIQNFGNTAATGDDKVILEDVFDPILDPINVTFNGEPWDEATGNYTYNPDTGEFSTDEGQITVPEATYSQDDDGRWVVSPGVSTLVVTGTI